MHSHGVCRAELIFECGVQRLGGPGRAGEMGKQVYVCAGCCESSEELIAPVRLEAAARRGGIP